MTAPRSIKPVSLLGPLTKHEERHMPAELWVAGDVELARAPARVSVVGSRKATEQGLRRAAKVATQLAQAGVVVVSGLAEGIDAAAHRACLGAAGRTVAVIGTPLDQVYPRKHAELQAHLARDHLVVSPFESGHRTAKQDFVSRNRVMAVMVHAGVVVEAGDASGTSSHARELARLGRPLFLMRSLVEDPDVAWPRKLLEQGAVVLDSVEQVLAVLRPR